MSQCGQAKVIVADQELQRTSLRIINRANYLVARMKQTTLPIDTLRTICCSLGLSKREADITQYIFEELREVEIGKELGISDHTVHTHLERMYRKLDVRSRCGLILRIFKHYVSITSSDLG